MKYQIFFKPKAIKDLKKISKEDAEKIAARIKEMENGLQGDVKKLTKHTHEYRLRVGDCVLLPAKQGSNLLVVSKCSFSYSDGVE